MDAPAKHHGNPNHDKLGRFTTAAGATAHPAGATKHAKHRKHQPAATRTMTEQEVDAHADHAMTQFNDELARGLTPAEAAGWAANTEAESQGNPAKHQDHGGIGRGLFQYGDPHPEHDKRLKFKQHTGIEVDQASAAQQRDFRDYELNNNEKIAANHIHAATTVTGKSRAITIYYLRPAHSSHEADERARIAEKIIKNYSPKSKKWRIHHMLMKYIKKNFCIFVILLLFNTCCYAETAKIMPYFYNTQLHIPPLSRADIIDMNKYYPLKDFHAFPKKLRLIFQRTESEAGNCKGSMGDHGERYKIVMRSCRISERLFDLLEDHGWCWGGGASAADDQWMLCSKLSALHRNYRAPKHP